MTIDSGQRVSPFAVDERQIAVADPARLDPNSDLVRSCRLQLQVANYKPFADFVADGRMHFNWRGYASLHILVKTG